MKKQDRISSDSEDGIFYIKDKEEFQKEVELFERSIWEEGYREGLKEARKELAEEEARKKKYAEGEKGKDIEIAINLLNNNIPIDAVLLATGLDRETLEKLMQIP